MLEGWRIVRARHADAAFTGEGAAKAGGRWNSRGVPVVYASGSLSLAVLETLVHLNPPVVLEYAVFRLQLDAGLIRTHPTGSLPSDWRTQPPPPSTRRIGDEWARKGETPVLAVPSVLVPAETNYVLNPMHPGFRQISIGGPELFVMDPRLLPRGRTTQ